MNERVRKKRGCWFYLLIFGFGLPVLLATFLGLFIVGRERAARQELNQRLAEISAQGLPIDNATMDAYFQSLTSDEHTQDWLELLGEVTSDEFDKSCPGVPVVGADVENPIPGPGAIWAEEEATRNFLRRWRRLHNRIAFYSRKQLAPDAMPVRFPLEFDSVNTLLPNTQRMRQAARLLFIQGCVAVYDRDSAATLRSIENMHGCAKVLDGEPILISQLVSIAIDGMKLDLVKRALQYDVLDDDDLSNLQRLLLQQINIDGTWKQAMAGERGMMLPIFGNPALAGEQLPGRIPGRSRDALYYLDFLDRTMTASTDDFDELRAELIAIEEDLEAQIGGSILRRLDSILTSLLTPATAAAGNAWIRDASMHRLAALCCGVRRFQHDNATWPESLADLQQYGLDANQLMPAGKKPFGYRVEEGQALMWGFDLHNNDSVPAEPPVTDEGVAFASQNELWIWPLELTEKMARQQIPVAPVAEGKPPTP